MNALQYEWKFQRNAITLNSLIISDRYYIFSYAGKRGKELYFTDGFALNYYAKHK